MRKLIVIGILSLALVTWAAVSLAGPGCRASHEKKSCSRAAVTKTCHGHLNETARRAAIDGADVQVSRLPSGAMLVIYSSDNPATVTALQKSATVGVDGFDCRLCETIAGDKPCTVELGTLQNGVVALVMADDAAIVDRYEKQFAALTEPVEQ